MSCIPKFKKINKMVDYKMVDVEVITLNESIFVYLYVSDSACVS